MRSEQGPLVVVATWDAEAEVWVAESDDIPGLATEAATVAAMTRKLRLLIPEMLALNEGAAAVEVPVELLWHKQEVISVNRA